MSKVRLLLDFGRPGPPAELTIEEVSIEVVRLCREILTTRTRFQLSAPAALGTTTVKGTLVGMEVTP